MLLTISQYPAILHTLFDGEKSSRRWSGLGNRGLRPPVPMSDGGHCGVDEESNLPYRETRGCTTVSLAVHLEVQCGFQDLRCEEGSGTAAFGVEIGSVRRRREKH